jgi:uncharacterized Zn finger protein (UPF0148 family)
MENQAITAPYSREYYNEKSRDYYQRHPEKKTEKETCPICGVQYIKLNKTNHVRSKRHQNAINTAHQKTALEIENDELKKQNEDLRQRVAELRMTLENPKLTEQRKQIKMSFYNSLKI